MRPLYFFDLPVYRLSRQKHHDEFEASKQKEMLNLGEYTLRYFEENPAAKSRMEESISASKTCWEYNEIIGYIQLHILGTQIRGEYFGVRAKRIAPTNKKIFEWKTWKLADEMEIPPQASSDEVFQIIIRYVESCGTILKGRTIDISKLIGIASYVDWRKLADA